MRTVRSILLATDYLRSSKAALHVAARLARAFDGTVSVLHVVDNTSSSFPILPFRKHLCEQSQASFLQELAAQQVAVGNSSIELGSPILRITRKADELDADIIVIGTGERCVQGHLRAGPVAEAVMQHARQPVFAVRPGEPTMAFRKILCPVDFSAVSQRGLRNAIRLARAFEGELVVHSVIPELSSLGAAVETGVWAGAKEQHAADWADEFDRFLAETDFSGVNWSRDARIGAPDQEIARAAREHQADLIVMGATGHTGLVRIMMGSVTRRVLQDLPCSILTVHDEDLFWDEPDEEDIRVSRLLFAEGKALVEAGDHAVALAKLNQVLAHNPFHLGALVAQAEVCEKLGRHERAQRCRRRVELLRHEGIL